MGNLITRSVTSEENLEGYSRSVASEENVEGYSRSVTRRAPPCHFRFKIESFSALSASSLERYEFCEFNAGDYKWRLAFYPNGNTKGAGKDHISLYLVLDKTCCNNLLNKEISVTFSLLAYDQIRDKYLSVQGVSHFHSMKFELCIDKFIPLKIFNDPSNGYLVKDSCMFGADVFVMESATSTGQCLSMIRVKRPVPFKYTWKIQNISALEDKCYYSDKFRTGDYDWKIEFYPKGHTIRSGNMANLFLKLADEETLLPAASREFIVEWKLHIVDQVDGKHEKGDTRSFITQQGWGASCFLDLSVLNKSGPSTGQLVNDTCILQAEVIVLGSAKNWV